jgi:hypothetical protein
MMMNPRLDNLISQWTRIGAGFSVAQSPVPPDVERMLLETARQAPHMARLFIMAATWLHRYGDLVAKHRLKRLIRDELEPEHRAALGLLLDIAQRGTHPAKFASIIRELTPATKARPLFDVERANARLAERARRRASPISARWGLWCEEIEFKDDALRPASWLMRENPGLVMRADFRGDLRASVLAALAHDRGARRGHAAAVNVVRRRALGVAGHAYRARGQQRRRICALRALDARDGAHVPPRACRRRHEARVTRVRRHAPHRARCRAPLLPPLPLPGLRGLRAQPASRTLLMNRLARPRSRRRCCCRSGRRA